MYLIINKTTKKFYFADNIYATLPSDNVAIKDYLKPDDATNYVVSGNNDGIVIDDAKLIKISNSDINSKIDILEKSLLRPLREYTLDSTNTIALARITQVEADIVTLRTGLQ